MCTSLRLTAAAALVLVTLISASTAHAQATASLRGTVTDPTGAVIPDATVTIKSSDNGSSRKTATDVNGEYKFLQVTPGDYNLIAEKSGFATITDTHIKLLVNTPATLDLKMSLSKAGEIVNVASEASQVNTTDASVGYPFSETQVRQLPLQTRNVVELLSLQPASRPAVKCSDPAAIRTTSRSTVPTSTTTKTQASSRRPQPPPSADIKVPTPTA